MLLNYDYYCQGELVEFIANQNRIAPIIIIIPGLLGSAANWRGFAKVLSQHSEVLVIDQRNHGNSPHVQTNSYSDMVQDLDDFLSQMQLDKVILCGHSMGGKVAMQYSQKFAYSVEKLIVLDIAPVKYTHNPAPFLNDLLALDLTSLQSRKDADNQLKTAIEEAAIRMFVLMNLKRGEHGFCWKINLEVIQQFLPHLSGYPVEDVVDAYANACLFINGEYSDYIKPSMHEEIVLRFPQAGFVTIAKAGHWLHVEQTEKVINQITQFLGK